MTERAPFELRSEPRWVVGGVSLRHRIVAASVGAVLALSVAVAAEPTPEKREFPNRTVTFVMPGPAGGGPDTVVRLIAGKLATRWGVPVIVENKPGATGTIGAEFVARGEATGYRLLFAFTALIQAPIVFAKVPYDVQRDFVPLVHVANAPVFLAVRADSKFRSISDLIIAARTKPISYGSFGNGSSYHIYGETLRRSRGLSMLHVPYKGEALALSDLLGGHIDATFVSVGTGASLVRDGQIRPLAMVSKSRSSQLPDVPTFDEVGVHGLDAVGWFGILAPAGIPQSVIKSLTEDINSVVADVTVTARLRQLGFDPIIDSSPKKFEAFLHAETQNWRNLILESGVKAQ